MASSSSNPNHPTTEEEDFTVINPADCELDFKIGSDKRTGSALFHHDFAYCWSGARGNIGITRGKYCFGCTIMFDQPVKMENTLDMQHNTRIGISRGDTPVDSLGQTEHSFVYNGVGTFKDAKGLMVYGERFGVGDTIVCSVNLERKYIPLVEFSKNGKRLGPIGIEVTNSPTGKLPWDSALFPHVLLRNTVVVFQFNTKQGLVPQKGYKPWDSAVKDGNAVFGPVFSDPKDCEEIMMVGLPASGKTTWAERWVEAHPEKRYILLGTDRALVKMMEPAICLELDNDISERLKVQATNIVNTLCSLAAKVYRNYIIDDCNYNKDSRRERLKHFASFRKIAVVVFPNKVELMARRAKRCKEIGKELSFTDINRMLVTFSFPMSKEMPKADEDFDEVIFTELSNTEAQQHLSEMKRDLLISCSMESPYPVDSSVYSGTGQSLIDWAEPAAQVNPANMDRGYARAGGPLLSKSMLPYSNNVNLTKLGRGEAQWHHNSVSSDSMMPASTFPGPGSHYLGFPCPSLEIQKNLGTGGSWIGQSEPTLQPNFANGNVGYTRVLQPDALRAMQQVPDIVNVRYTGVGQPDALRAMQQFPDNVNVGYTGVGQPDASGLMRPISNNVNIGYPWGQQPAALELMEPYSHNVNIGDTGVGQLNALESMQPFSTNVNTIPESSVHYGRLDPSTELPFPLGSLNPGRDSTYSNPIYEESRGYPMTYSDFRDHVRGKNPVRYSTYLHDSDGTHEPRSDYRPPYVSQHGTPNSVRQRIYPADEQHRRSRTAPDRPPGF